MGREVTIVDPMETEIVEGEIINPRWKGFSIIDNTRDEVDDLMEALASMGTARKQTRALKNGVIRATAEINAFNHHLAGQLGELVQSSTVPPVTSSPKVSSTMERQADINRRVQGFMGTLQEKIRERKEAEANSAEAEIQDRVTDETIHDEETSGES
jgi:hypothetical protein